MELPDPLSYPSEVVTLPLGVYYRMCSHCKREVGMIDGKIDNHIMGCAFRSRWHAIRHWLAEQSLKQSFQNVNDKLKKLEDGDIL
jgi:hypothetical protein